MHGYVWLICCDLINREIGFYCHWEITRWRLRLGYRGASICAPVTRRSGRVGGTVVRASPRLQSPFLGPRSFPIGRRVPRSSGAQTLGQRGRVFWKQRGRTVGRCTEPAPPASSPGLCFQGLGLSPAPRSGDVGFRPRPVRCASVSLRKLIFNNSLGHPVRHVPEVGPKLPLL